MKTSILPRLLIFTLIIASNACSLFDGPNLARRYRNLSHKNTFDAIDVARISETFVSVDLNSTYIVAKKKANVEYNVLSLSERGQQAFISAAEEKAATNEEFLKIVNSNFDLVKKATTKTRIIPKNIKKSIVFTIDRKHYIEQQNSDITFNIIGDRVAFLELVLRIKNESTAEFNSWDKYVSDKAILNLGNISSTQNWNASLNVGAKGTGQVVTSSGNISEDAFTETTAVLVNPKAMSESDNGYQILNSGKETDSTGDSVTGTTEIGGTATLGYSNTSETSLTLNSRILQLSGSIAPREIVLRQESGPGIDLSGNVIISIEYTLKDDWAVPQSLTKLKKLYLPTGKPKQVSSIDIDHTLLMFPDIKTDIIGELDYTFLYRQIQKGSRHLPEARQKVLYKFGKVPSPQNSQLRDGVVTLIKKQDIRPKVFMIKKSSNLTVPPEYLSLKDKRLVFESASEAIACLSYIYDVANEGYAISDFKFGATSIVNRDIEDLQIVTIQL